MDHDDIAAALIEAGRRAWQLGWVPATSGNLSARRGDGAILVTESGRDKGALRPEHLLLLDASGQPLERGRRASAETPLHLARYTADPSIRAIVHTHAHNAVVLSRLLGGTFVIQGYELQKALRGVSSHLEPVVVPVLDNAQDTVALSHEAEAAIRATPGPVWGYLIRGHGLYAWGRDVEEAMRHTEALDALFGYLLEERRCA